MKSGPGADVGTHVMRAGCVRGTRCDQLRGSVRLEVSGKSVDVVFTTRSPQPHSQAEASASSPGMCAAKRAPRT